MEEDHNDNKKNDYTRWRAHVVLVSYPTQGHVNPMLQFSRRLASKGLKSTLAITTCIYNTFDRPSDPHVNFETISDGYDEGGFSQAKTTQEYLTRFQSVGSDTLARLITKHKSSDSPVDCIVYDPFLPWALRVGRDFGLHAAPFFTQPCAVNFIYHSVYNGLVELPLTSSAFNIDGLPLLEVRDLPSFIAVWGSYPAYTQMLLNQFSDVDQADWVFVNTAYRFEPQAADAMARICPRLFTVGPTVPSSYLDNRIENDKSYGLDLLSGSSSSTSTTITDWLCSKPKGSVIYVSFGSLSGLTDNQMEQLALAFTESLTTFNYQFLWVVRDSEQAKLPQWFLQHEKALLLLDDHDHNSSEAEKAEILVVKWSSQLEVLSHHSVGCFFTHCGWNSTLEALCLGVPMVGMAQWTDQPTNAKFVEDVWKVGVRVRVDEEGVAGKEEIKSKIRQVMEDDTKGRELKENAIKWRRTALEAVSEGGTSDTSIDDFVTCLANKNCN